MIATLIPFFLVSRIIVDTPWKNGPEFVFQAEANVTLQQEERTPLDAYKMNSRLLCRPKESVTLSCRLEEFVLRPGNASDPTRRIYDLSGAGEPFEVTFDDLGVESLVVPRDTPTRRLNVMRAVARQLTVGVDLADKTDGVYTIPATNVEECAFTLQIAHPPRSLVMEPKAKNQVYRLESLPRLNKPNVTDIEIRKRRDGAECRPSEAFVFDDIVLLEDVERYGNIVNLEENLESSESVITVSNIGFRSFTKNEGVATVPESNMKVKISESIRLILTNIHPARDELPTVPTPARTFVKANASLKPL